jgi:hypothetical protein
MFEEFDTKQVPVNSAQTGNQPSQNDYAGASQPTVDIFAETDKNSKPAVLQPINGSTPLESSTLSMDAGNRQKMIIVSLGIVFIIAIIAGLIWGISRLNFMKTVPVSEKAETNVTAPAKETEQKTSQPDQPVVTESQGQTVTDKETMKNIPLPGQVATPTSQIPSEPSSAVVPPVDSQAVINQESGASLDSDKDGLTNAEEVQNGTDPSNSDSDNDSLSDFDEIKTYKTNPLKPDTDGDGFMDGAEVKGGYNPNGSGKLIK